MSLLKLFRSKPKFQFNRIRCAMVDLETFDRVNTAGFYAIGARMFTLGEYAGELRVDPDAPSHDDNQVEECSDFIQYIAPSQTVEDARFTHDEETMRWTMEKNKVEYDRAVVHGTTIVDALQKFNKWLRYHQPECMVSNSPSFDHEILRHAFRVLELGPMRMGFRTDFDVRTVGHLRHTAGMRRYPNVGNNRLHSPLDDCTLQINGLAEFIRFIENKTA